MDKPQEVDFGYLLGAGIVMMLVLVMVVVIFVIIHQKRAYSLHEQLQQQELDYQHNMLKSVVASQENERERIAQDLHDEIGASLSAARLFINQVQYEVTDAHLQDLSLQAGQILGETIQNVRHIIQNISPAMLEKFGLIQALTMLGKRIESMGLQVELFVHEEVESLDVEAQLALYRIVQELFGNVVKHAQAHFLVLSLTPADGKLRLHVSDDGQGFTPDAAGPAQAASMGLSGIRARAKLLNADMQITSVPGQGTHITLLIPY